MDVSALCAAALTATSPSSAEVDGTDYGYFWWRPRIRVATPAGEQRITYNAAQGNGGQKIDLFPQFGLVAVITAGAYKVRTPSNALMAAAVLPRRLQAMKNAE